VTSLVHRNAGLRFAVSETGEGRPIIFQHGLCGDASQMADVFPADGGWCCTTLECRGHGKSEAGAPAHFSISTFAADVASLIEARGLPPIVIGGISMGAVIALRLAVLRPELVSALVLARPAWFYEAAPANMQPNAVVGELLRRFPPDQARARFEASELARQLEEEAPDNLASLQGFFSREPISITRELLCRISADGPGVSSDGIGSISVPALIIGHKRDLVHPLSIAQALAALIPRVNLVEITAKADSRERYCDDFRQALAAFLKGL
jgi:pimeloyl-ACP methyl ester carboxylesterase